MLLYFVALTLLATLSPFDFQARSLHRFAWLFLADDFALNLLLFLPLGFMSQLAVAPHGSSLLRVVASALALSAAPEAAQLFLPSRHSNLVDVLANTGGAAMGALLARGISRSLSGLRAQALVLELPVTGALYLLFALTGVLGFGVVRALDLARVLPLAAFGAVHLAALLRERLARDAIIGAFRLACYASGAAVGALLVPLLHRPVATLLVAVVFGACTWWFVPRGGEREAVQRRFEAATAVRALPWFLLYLVLLGMHRPSTTALGNQASLLLLELCLAHTVLGYLLGELRSRAARGQALLIAQSTLAGMPVALSLELAHGHGSIAQHTGRWLLFTLSVCAGAALHRAQVELVRSYRAC